MRVVALVSGGKDSCYNMMQCVKHSHCIVALANLRPPERHVQEMDSYMYQTVGHSVLQLYSDALNVPLFRGDIRGSAVVQSKQYTRTRHDEVEDLYELLSEVKRHVQFEAVSVGAILSDYQRVRVEDVCERLGVVSLCYLWRRDQSELLREIISCQVEAIIIKVACLGLTPDRHLGLTLSQVQPHLLHLAEQFSVNVCGEGGEYETFTVDCPLFRRRIVIDRCRVVTLNDDPVVTVGYLHLEDAHLEDKASGTCCKDVGDPRMRLVGLPMPSLLPDSVLVKHEHHDNTSQSSSDYDDDANDVDDDLEAAPSIQLAQNGSWLLFSRVVGVRARGHLGVERALRRLSVVLATRGIHLGHVARLDMYIANMQQYRRINDEYRRAMRDDEARPARLCVAAPLPRQWTVNISGAAYLPRPHVLHVRSWSQWAPACLGPYSQAARCQRLLFVAGQVGIEAGSQRLPADAAHQARLALRHAKRIMQAADPRELVVCQCVCYLADGDGDLASSLLDTCTRLARDTWCDALLCFVVVPSLPCGASVEWHVLAHAHTTYASWRRRNSRLCVDGVHVDVQVYHSPSDHVALLCATCEFGTGSGGASVTQLQCCVRSSARLLLTVNGDSDSVGCLTVFYQQDMFPWEQCANLDAPAGCVLHTVAVNQVADGNSDCVIVGMATSNGQLKQE